MHTRQNFQGYATTEFYLTILVVCVLLGLVTSKMFGAIIGLSIGLGIPLMMIIIGVLGVYGERKAYQAYCQTIKDIERVYPDGRATKLSSGKWLISSRTTGEILDEISWPTQ